MLMGGGKTGMSTLTQIHSFDNNGSTDIPQILNLPSQHPKRKLICAIAQTHSNSFGANFAPSIDGNLMTVVRADRNSNSDDGQRGGVFIIDFPYGRTCTFDVLPFRTSLMVYSVNGDVTINSTGNNNAGNSTAGITLSVAANSFTLIYAAKEFDTLITSTSNITPVQAEYCIGNNRRGVFSHKPVTATSQLYKSVNPVHIIGGANFSVI